MGLLVAATLAGAAAVPGCGPADAPAKYVHLGEGRSSATSATAIEFASPRTFSLYLLDEACRTSRAREVMRLRASPPRLALRVGQPFSPGTLTVVATGLSGELRPAVPIAVEVRSAPGVFDLRQDVLAELGLVPARAASVTLRVRTICPGTGAAVLVPADIVAR